MVEIGLVSEIAHQSLKVASLISAVGILGFSYPVREAIRRRANGKCEVTGWEIDKPECSHISHDKSSPAYNDPANGRGVAKSIHYIEHLLQRDPSLPPHQHNWASKGVWGRMDEKDREQFEYLWNNHSIEELHQLIDP